MKRNLNALSDDLFDLIVIGGGIYGAWIAWDATLRGLYVALIERKDFGQETSANSLKTVHGGLRYLQDADIRLVRMMIRERAAYLRIAPHLVHPLACLMPTYSKVMRSRPVLGVALKLNDLFGIDRNTQIEADKHLAPGRLLTREDCLAALPGIEDTGVTGGAVWFDGQIYNSERLTLSLVKSAAGKGAVVANYVEGVRFLTDESHVTGVQADDILSGRKFDIRSKLVVNATGPWIDRVLKAAPSGSKEKRFQHSLAMNIITDKFITDYAAGIPSWPNEARNGREKRSHMLFISPWKEYSIVGTFHSHYRGDPEQFQVKEDQLQSILDEINSGYPGADLGLDDIRFVHRGFLPEVESGGQVEVRLVRSGKIFDHKVLEGVDGLITVLGVKYTSARQVAEKAVDLVFQHFDRIAPACRTQFTRLEDGQIDNYSHYLENAKEEAKGFMAPRLVEELVKSYGSEYPTIKKRIYSQGYNSPLSLRFPEIMRAEIQHAVEDEMAEKLSDVVQRRTDLGSAGRPASTELLFCAQLMGEASGWDNARINSELEAVGSVYDSLGV